VVLFRLGLGRPSRIVRAAPAALLNFVQPEHIFKLYRSYIEEPHGNAPCDNAASRPSSRLISFEHAVFLLGALWRGEEMVIGACRDCGAVLVTDRWAMRASSCSVCAPPTRAAGVPL
jgi:hypothetical protein